MHYVLMTTQTIKSSSASFRALDSVNHAVSLASQELSHVTLLPQSQENDCVFDEYRLRGPKQIVFMGTEG
jgi:hypothetical protein